MPETINTPSANTNTAQSLSAAHRDALAALSANILSALNQKPITVTDPVTKQPVSIAPVTGVEVDISAAKNGGKEEQSLNIKLKISHDKTIYYKEIAQAAEQVFKDKYPALATLPRGAEGSPKDTDDYNYEFKIPQGMDISALLTSLLNNKPAPAVQPEAGMPGIAVDQSTTGVDQSDTTNAIIPVSVAKPVTSARGGSNGPVTIVITPTVTNNITPAAIAAASGGKSHSKPNAISASEADNESLSLPGKFTTSLNPAEPITQKSISPAAVTERKESGIDSVPGL